MEAQPLSDQPNGGFIAGGRGKRRSARGGWSLSTVLMICALVIYPLSVGPLSWCWEEVVLSQDDANEFRARRDRGVAEAPFIGRLYVLPGMYQPLMWAYGAAPMVRSVMDSYMRMWGRLLVLQPLPHFQFRFPKLSPWEDSRSTGLPVQISCRGPGGGSSAVSDFLGGGEGDGAGADVGTRSPGGAEESGSGLEFSPYSPRLIWR